MLEPNFQPFPILETERLVLNQLVEEDAEVYFRMRTNPRIRQYMDKDPDENVAASLKKIQEIEGTRLENKAINWVLRLKESNEFIGDLGMWRFDIAHHRAEIGYSMFPAFHGKGYMTEALNRMLDFAFQDIKLHSLEANTHPDNESSMALLKRVGFRQEAYFTENYFYAGKFLDSRIFSLLEKWRS